MREKTIKNLYHYTIKFLFVVIPLLLLVLAFCGFSEKRVEYKYESNAVYSASDLIDGNVYHFHLDPYISADFTTTTQIRYYEILNFNIFSGGSWNPAGTASDIPYIEISNSSLQFCYFPDSHSATPSCAVRYNSGTSFDFDFIYKSGGLLNDVSMISTSDYNEISSVNSIPLMSGLYDFFNNFIQLPINQWYSDLLTLLGITFSLNNALGIVCYMPLWIIYVYILDLALDFMLFIPKLADKWLTKLYGGD